MMPSQDQIMGILRALLAAGGPVAALLMSYGVSEQRANLWLTLALAIIPPVVAAVWSAISNSQAKLAVAASTVPGVTVTANKDAAPTSVVAAALDKSNAVKLGLD
jgi:hypothetical protein